MFFPVIVGLIKISSSAKTQSNTLLTFLGCGFRLKVICAQGFSWSSTIVGLWVYLGFRLYLVFLGLWVNLVLSFGFLVSSLVGILVLGLYLVDYRFTWACDFGFYLVGLGLIELQFTWAFRSSWAFGFSVACLFGLSFPVRPF